MGTVLGGVVLPVPTGSSCTVAEHEMTSNVELKWLGLAINDSLAYTE